MSKKPKIIPAWRPATNFAEDFHLTDEQWIKLSDTGGLLPEARIELENAIAFYRGLVQAFSNQPTSTATKKKLHDLSLTAQTFIQQLKEGGNDVDGILAMKVPAQSGLQLLTGYNYLQRFREELERFTSYCEQASAEISPSKRGPSREDVDILMSHLDRILIHFSHKHSSGLTRSTNRGSPMEFVVNVFAIADTNIDSGSLDASAKHVIAKKIRKS